MDIDDIVATFQIYRQASDINNFQGWIRDYHKIEDYSPLFLGYRYFLEICAIRIVDEIAENSTLGLDEDESFLFANECRLPLDEIPNTCDKIIALKNIWRYFEPIKNAQDWAELEKIIHKSGDILKIFNEVFKNVSVNEKHSEKIALNFITLHYLNIHFNDTQRLKPMGAATGLIKSEIDSPGIEYFKGYAYTLEYLWYQLLGKEEFENSPAKNIHKLECGVKDDDSHQLNENYSIPDPEDPTFEERCIAWEGLDHLCRPLFDICISPKYKKYLTQYSQPCDSVFILCTTIDDKIISPLLDRTYIKEPYYFSDDSTDEARFKKIDYYFKWLPVAYIDSGKVHDFFGTYAFIPFLQGLTTSEKVSRVNKIEVIRIKHPEIGVSGYFYSYALLNKASFFNGHGMGWIIFLACGTDFSGHGGSMHETAEKYIQKYQNIGILEIKEITVDEDIIRRFLKERSGTLVSDTNTSLEDLLEFGESQTVEYKSSLLWSHEKNQPSGSSVYDTARTLSAFLNSNGGTLLIGVDKNRNIVGLEKDYALLTPSRNQNRDGFEIRCNEVVNTFLGKEYRQDIEIFFEGYNGKDICRIIVNPSTEPVFLINSKINEFFIRSGNVTQILKGREISNYIIKHWNCKK